MQHILYLCTAHFIVPQSTQLRTFIININLLVFRVNCIKNYNHYAKFKEHLQETSKNSSQAKKASKYLAH